MPISRHGSKTYRPQVPIAAGNAIPGDPYPDLSWPVTYKFSEDLDALTVPGVPFDIIDRAIQRPGREIEGDNEVYDRLLMGASPLFHEWERLALEAGPNDPYAATCGRREAF